MEYPRQGHFARLLLLGARWHNKEQKSQSGSERDLHEQPRQRLLESASCRPSSFPTNEAEPWIHLPFCPDKAIFAGLSGSFAPCPLPALTGRRDRLYMPDAVRSQ
jgi:hypothetical protein